MPDEQITVVEAGWVIPVAPADEALEDHAVVIRNGLIEAVLSREAARAAYPDARRVSRPGHALIPGLVNAHTHAAMTLFRGLADDLPLMTWLKQHIWPAEVRHAGPEFVRDGSLLAFAEMIRGGTTCFNDMYFFPDEVARLASSTGLRAVIGQIFIEFPTAWARDDEEYIQKGLAVHDAYRDDPLITTAFAPHAPYSVSAANLERLRTLSDELDVPVHIHLHETAHEVESVEPRPFATLDRLGLIGPNLIAVHMTQVTPEELERAGAARLNVVHCPESNLKLASGFCPAASLLASGANVALGTDGAASNNDLDMFGEMRTAALLAKAVAEDAAALPAAVSLRMATLGGAIALGLEDRIGSLEPGKEADLVAVDLAPVETQPMYHPISQLVYATGRSQVTDVWVAGQRLLRDRQLETVDEDRLEHVAHAWRDRLMELSADDTIE